MAKAKLIIELCIIFGFIFILTGTMMLLVGAMRENNNIILFGFIPLGLGLLTYFVIFILVLINLKKKNR